MHTICIKCGKLIPQGGGRRRCSSCHQTNRQAIAKRRPYQSRAAYQTPEWRRARATAIAWAGGQCTRCGSTHDLIVHHILPVAQGGGNNQENLQVGHHIPIGDTCHAANAASATACANTLKNAGLTLEDFNQCPAAITHAASSPPSSPAQAATPANATSANRVNNDSSSTVASTDDHNDQ